MKTLHASFFYLFALLVSSSLFLVFAFSQNAYAAQTNYCANLTLSLQYGDSDSTKSGQVSRLQNFLKLYYSLDDVILPATGNFRTITQSYVTKFQTDNGIDPVGSVGPITRAKINSFCGQTSQTQGSSSMLSGVQGQNSCPGVAVPACTGTLQPVMQNACVVSYNCIAAGAGASTAAASTNTGASTAASSAQTTMISSADALARKLAELGAATKSTTATTPSTDELDRKTGGLQAPANCPPMQQVICGPNEEHWGTSVSGCPVDGCRLRQAWCVDPEKSTKQRRSACPSGQTGAIYESSAAMCSAAGAVSWGEWSLYKNTCSTSSVLSCAAGGKTYPNGSIVSMYTILADVFQGMDGTEAADTYMPGGAPRYKCIERDWVCSSNCEADTTLSIPFYL